ncbi:MAG: hypothetical protein U0Q18_19310 [Bryobacteraceae bacterium]
MNAKAEMSAQQQVERGAHDEEEKDESAKVSHAPGELTFVQNAIGTIKVLAIAGSVVAALWGLDLWVSHK